MEPLTLAIQGPIVSINLSSVKPFFYYPVEILFYDNKTSKEMENPREFCRKFDHLTKECFKRKRKVHRGIGSRQKAEIKQKKA